MTKMLTLFGREISELKYNDLHREKRMQKFMLATIKNALQRERYKRKKRTVVTDISKDKETLLEIYQAHLEAFINEIDYYLARRSEPLENAKGGHKTKTQIRAWNAEKRKAVIAENARMYKWQKSLDRDNTLVSWDREKFMLIAADRGYQTDEAIIQDVGNELKLDRARAKAIIDRGRFTWGQVLCLGAMFEMTPKEFCDTFLAGYFTDQNGEYRADYENVSRIELLKQTIKPIEYDIVEVGADGKPLDEEEWFD